MMTDNGTLDDLVAKIRGCEICLSAQKPLPHKPRPVLRVSETARILIAGQAPGTRVHASGKPFTDPSGDRLRQWMQVSEAEFYDTSKIAILPMGFCFPGLDAKKADLPPRRECAPVWRQPVLDLMPNLKLTLLIGGYAQKWHLGKANGKSITATVENWRAFAPDIFPTPHPSWRNNAWLKKHPWFEDELLPQLRGAVRQSLSS